MVLHVECHESPEVFIKLHGFDIQYLDNYKKVPKAPRIKKMIKPISERIILRNNVFELQSKGLSIKEIALQLGISSGQVYRRIHYRDIGQ